MKHRADIEAVRPLGTPPRQTGQPRLPGLIAVVLLVAGGTGGYLFGLPGDTADAGAATTTTTAATAPAANETPLHYQWLQQDPVENDQDAWAVSAAAELDGDIYLLVSDDYETPLNRVLWRSADGEKWELVRLDLGGDTQVTDLDVYEDSLLLSGWIGTAPTIWRSQSLAGAADPIWTTIQLSSDLPAIGEVVTGFSAVTSVVNPTGRIITTATVAVSLEDKLLSLTDDTSVTSLLHLDELPEVAVSDSRLWMRIVAPGGAESVHTESIPETARVKPVAGVYGTDIERLQAWAMWTSADAGSFIPIDPPAEPDPLRPQPFGDGFVAASNDGHLWTLAGDLWEPSRWVTPQECGGWTTTGADGHRLLAVSDNFDTVCVSTDGTNWIVRESPRTAVSSQAMIWIEGGRGGFIAVASNSLEYAVLTSSDGLSWAQVNATPDILGTRAFLVGDRLVTTARPVGDMSPLPMVVWVGEPENG